MIGRETRIGHHAPGRRPLSGLGSYSARSESARECTVVSVLHTPSNSGEKRTTPPGPGPALSSKTRAMKASSGASCSQRKPREEAGTKPNLG